MNVAGTIRIALTIGFVLSASPLIAQEKVPAWRRALPRAEYAHLPRVPVAEAWFEVYRVAPGVFAIYEPHQSEETISYLIVGDKLALLFDTGMGIGDIRKITGGRPKLTHASRSC